MTAQRFTVSTRRTGILRVVRVDVLEPDEFERLYQREWRRRGIDHREIVVAGQDLVVQGTVIPRLDWVDRDPRPYQARMLLSRPALTGTLIAHEATHAALHLYSIDSYRGHARASAHLHIGNELIPYLVGDLFSAILQRLDLGGEPLPTGWGRDYRDRLDPPAPRV